MEKIHLNCLKPTHLDKLVCNNGVIDLFDETSVSKEQKILDDFYSSITQCFDDNGTKANNSVYNEFRRRQALDLLSPKESDIFAEVGAGDCVLAHAFWDVVNFSFCFDTSESCLKRAAHLYKPGDNVFLAKTHAENLPVKDESIDKLLCSEVLEHVLDDSVLLRELRRVLKPNGRLLLEVPLEYNLKSKKFFLNRLSSGFLYKPDCKTNKELIGKVPHIRKYHRSFFKKFVESHGFKTEAETSNTSYLDYIKSRRQYWTYQKYSKIMSLVLRLPLLWGSHVLLLKKV